MSFLVWASSRALSDVRNPTSQLDHHLICLFLSLMWRQKGDNIFIHLAGRSEFYLSELAGCRPSTHSVWFGNSASVPSSGPAHIGKGSKEKSCSNKGSKE